MCTACAGCGTVSVHLFCDECNAKYSPEERQEMWKEECERSKEPYYGIDGEAIKPDPEFDAWLASLPDDDTDEARERARQQEISDIRYGGVI